MAKLLERAREGGIGYRLKAATCQAFACCHKSILGVRSGNDSKTLALPSVGILQIISDQ